MSDYDAWRSEKPLHVVWIDEFSLCMMVHSGGHGYSGRCHCTVVGFFECGLCVQLSNWIMLYANGGLPDPPLWDTWQPLTRCRCVLKQRKATTTLSVVFTHKDKSLTETTNDIHVLPRGGPPEVVVRV